MEQWYHLDSQRNNVGPMDLDALKAKIASGEVKANTYVWEKSRSPNWTKAGEHPDLMHLFIGNNPEAAPGVRPGTSEGGETGDGDSEASANLGRDDGEDEVGMDDEGSLELGSIHGIARGGSFDDAPVNKFGEKIYLEVDDRVDFGVPFSRTPFMVYIALLAILAIIHFATRMTSGLGGILTPAHAVVYGLCVLWLMWTMVNFIKLSNNALLVPMNPYITVAFLPVPIYGLYPVYVMMKSVTKRYNKLKERYGVEKAPYNGVFTFAIIYVSWFLSLYPMFWLFSAILIGIPVFFMSKGIDAFHEKWDSIRGT